MTLKGANLLRGQEAVAFGTIRSDTGGGKAPAGSRGAAPSLGLEANPICKSRVCPGRALWPEDTGLLRLELAGTHGWCRVPDEAGEGTSACQATVPSAAPRGWTHTPSCPPLVFQATP